MARPALVDTLTASNAVVAEQIFGDVYQTAAGTPPREFVLDFDLDAAAHGFVGRDAVFKQLDAFAAQHLAGYFEIVADAGLGKTALAAEIARRRAAVAFLASASSGVQRPDQFLAHVSAALIVRHQLSYNTLPARVGDDATFLGRILRESVNATSGGPIWVVVDGLDEAVEPPPGSNPLLLPPELPAGVYIVVTRRAGQLVTAPSTPSQRYTLRRDDPLQTADIQTLVRTRTESDSRITDALAGSRPPVSADEFVARLTEFSEGNFMYLSYVLADIAAREPGELPMDLNELPQGLRGYYDQFWARISPAQSQSWADWDNLYRPVVERLAVAGEAVTADWLAAQVGRSPGEVRTRVLEPWVRVLSRGRWDGVPTWRLVHRTFGEYLEDKLDLGDAHRRVASYYVDQRWGQFDQWDDYGLRYTATHLAQAADRTAAQERHDLVARLVRLVTDQGFQRTQLERLRDPTLLRRDLEQAHRLAAKDDDADATFLLVLVALTLVRFRRQLLQPEAVFEAARRGEVRAAERLLDLFSGEIDPDWHDAILLTVAWLASESAPGEAVQVRNRVRDANPSSPTLQWLLERVTAALDGGLVSPVPLPAAATPEQAKGMVARLAGAGDSSLYAATDPELLGGELLGGGGYLASVDGPLLVALAKEEPAIGESLLRRYVDVHIAYGYRQYRNASLWELLDAVLRHPEQSWVREWLGHLGLAVLAAPNRGEFLEGLEIAVLALQAKTGDAAATQELTARRNAAVQQASALPVVPIRGQGDVWGVHRRRLAALAEAVSQLPTGASDAADLADKALEIERGFAGFSAPASLTLAETVSVASPADTGSVGRALTAAEAAANNIQDATFCARTTARVTAMRERWWPLPPLDPIQPAAVVSRLSRDPSAPEFGAVHVVGEQYRYREPTSRVLLPPQMLAADTLGQLAEVYQRPLQEFLRYNEEQGWAPDEQLPKDTRVKVPDPGFPPLLAARLSAAILADGPSPALSALMRHLVPVSGIDITALGTVLTRLLLCSPTQDVQLLAQLRRLVTETTATTPAE
jgi:hypothetical protein